MQYLSVFLDNKILKTRRYFNILYVCILALILLCSGKATHAESNPDAKSPPPALDSIPTPPVTVTAPDPNKIRDMVTEFGEVFSGDRLSRWKTPICPYMVGIIEEQKNIIFNRLKEIAKAAGIETAPDRCDANILVIVTSEPLKVRQGVAARNRALLNTNDKWPIDNTQLSYFSQDDNAPVHIFYSFGEAPASGGVATQNLNILNIGQPNAFSLATTYSGYSPSRLTPTMDSIFQRIFIVIDANKLSGINIRQFSDYISMASLAEIRPSMAQKSASSIEDLFIDVKLNREPPSSLTFWDRAYLGALYSSPSEINVSSQISTMSLRIAKTIHALKNPDR